VAGQYLIYGAGTMGLLLGQLVKHSGRAGCLAWRGADATATFSPFRVYNDEIKIVGSMAVLHSFERALSLLVKGVIDCQAMITAQFTLDDDAKAIDTFLAGSGLKTQVSPTR
jgi:threonine dehydrogenase-like Zn-dependent dehydrogenase